MEGYVVVERIILKLLDAEGDSLHIGMNLHYNCLDLVALLVLADSFLAGNGPGNVGKVNKSVDSAVKADEDAEVSD